MKKIKNKPSLNRDYFKRLLNHVFIFLLILFLPTQLGKHFFFSFSYLSGVRVDYLAPTIYLTDIIVFLLTIINLKLIIGFLKQKQVLIILVLLLINLLTSQSVSISIYRYIKTIEILILGFIAYQLFLREQLLLIGFLISGLVELVLSILQLVYKHSLQSVFYFLGERYLSLSMPGIAKASIEGVEFLRPYATFSHPNSLAGFYLLLYFFVLTNKKFGRFLLLKYLSLFVFSILIFISFSKVVILTFAILNALYLLLNTKPLCKICSFSKIFTLLLISVVFLQAQTDPLTVSKRLELIKNSLLIITQHPLTGVGIGAYLVVQNNYVSKFQYFFNQPVHNIFLLIIAELGIPMTMFFLYVFIPILKKFFTFHFLLLIVFIITGFFDHYWLTLQQNFLLAGLIIGLNLRK